VTVTATLDRIVLDLPWPSPAARSMNKRRAAVRSCAVTRQMRLEAMVAARAAVQHATGDTAPEAWPRAEIAWVLYPPDRTRRDWDNVVGTLKPYQDGVCDAGLIERDDIFGLSCGGVRLGRVDKERPRVELTLTRLREVDE
jgi:hypothetical protein